jgi:hypothetical protein
MIAETWQSVIESTGVSLDASTDDSDDDDEDGEHGMDDDAEEILDDLLGL